MGVSGELKLAWGRSCTCPPALHTDHAPCARSSVGIERGTKTNKTKQAMSHDESWMSLGSAWFLCEWACFTGSQPLWGANSINLRRAVLLEQLHERRYLCGRQNRLATGNPDMKRTIHTHAYAQLHTLHVYSVVQTESTLGRQLPQSFPAGHAIDF